MLPLRRAASLLFQPRAFSAACQARCFQSLPIIDGADAKAAVARELDAACRDVGFFYVNNHGMAPEVYEGVLAAARKWFGLPEEAKRSIALSPHSHFRGYQEKTSEWHLVFAGAAGALALGANVTRYVTEDGGSGFARDWHEAIDLYKEEDPAAVAARGDAPSPIHGPNPWPSQLPEFTAVLKQYIADMTGLGAAIMRGIALGLGLPETYFEGPRAGDPYWVVRVIHYPVIPGQIKQAAAHALGGSEVERSVQLSCGEHTDYGLLTLVNQETHIPALQVKNAAGEWITATPVPGTFVCNIGDMLKVWSNGRYTPTAHRVINADPSRSRVSIPFFYEPCYEAVVAPPEELCGPGRPPLYPPVRYGSHLESKVLSNFEL